MSSIEYVSSNKWTRYDSAASWIAPIAVLIHRKPPGCPTNPCTNSPEISRTYHQTYNPRHILISKKGAWQSNCLLTFDTFESPLSPVYQVDIVASFPLERDHQLYLSSAHLGTYVVRLLFVQRGIVANDHWGVYPRVEPRSLWSRGEHLYRQGSGGSPERQGHCHA